MNKKWYLIYGGKLYIGRKRIISIAMYCSVSHTHTHWKLPNMCSLLFVVHKGIEIGMRDAGDFSFIYNVLFH